MASPMTNVRAALASLLALAAACGGPPGVSPGLDTFVCPADGGACVQPAAPGSVEGTVVYTGTRRGDVILFLFSSANLPPPDGTATSAVALARIPAARFFAGQAGAGPFSAPFTFTQVAPGSYQIRGFIDAAGEFDPFFDYLQGARAGNPAGGHVEFVGGVPRLANFDVPSNGVARAINVALGAETLFDPPSFKLADGSPSTFLQSIDRPQLITLQTINLGIPRASFQNARFAVELDRGADGLPRISDGDGLVDVYPKVILRQTQALVSGQLVPVTGEQQAIVPCKVNPLPVLPLLLASVPGANPIGLEKVQVIVQSLAVKLIAGVPVPQATIPAGKYQLVVIQKSGQVWILPNSLGSSAAVPAAVQQTQGLSFTFDATTAPGGAIAGKVIYPAGRVPGNLVVQAFRGGPAAAPPLAASLPVRVKLVPKRFLGLDAATNTANYVIDGLPPGSYAIEALDDGDGNFGGFNLLQTPTKGDLIGGVLDPLGHLETIAVASSVISGKDVTMVSAPGKDPSGAGTALDSPAFELDESAGPAQIAQDARATVRITAVAKPVAFPAGAGDDATTFFTVGLVRDSGGATVDSDGDGLPDVWPRAFLVKLDDADARGLTQASPTTVIPAAVDPLPYLPALLAGSASAVVPVKRLSIVVRPAALDATNPLAPVRLPAMPAGKYKVVLMNKTGQLWQIPNEAGPASLDPRAVCPTPTTCGAGQVSTASQGRSFAAVPPSGAVPPGAITGTFRVVGGAAAAIKAAYVFAFRAEDPPPPLGTGRPISAAVHLGSELVVDGADKKIDFALRALPSGDYYVLGVADTRGDFALDPFLFAAAPGPGALAGGHLDAGGKLAKVTVVATTVAAQDVLAAAAAPLPVRPSFVLADAAGTQLAADAAGLTSFGTTPLKLKLQARTLLGSAVSAVPETGTPAFVVELLCDAAGKTVDGDYDNLPDVYPTIRLVKLDPTDPTGMRYDTSSGGLVAIPAAVDPTPLLGSGGLSCAGTKKTLKGELTVLVSPAAVKQVPGQAVQPLASVPAGRYGVVLVSGTGQVWRLPNELQPAMLDPRTPALAPAALPLLATQALGVAVAQGGTPPDGAVNGNVLLTGYAPASVGNVLLAAYRAADPPPPAGTGRPVMAKLVPRPLVGLAAQAGRLAYSLGGLPPDTYLVAAMHDQEDRFNPILSYLATPGAFAQIAFAGGVPTPIVVGSSAAAAPDVVLDQTATAALPFERPMFAVGTLPAVLPAGAAAPISFKLVSASPSALPTGLLPSGGGTLDPAFHPRLALSGSTPLKTADGRWAVTTKILLTPTGAGTLGVIASVDPRPFCAQLVSGADAECTTGTPNPAAVAQVNELTVVVRHDLSLDLVSKSPVGGRPPSGAYRITAIDFTGQTWSIPNELATSGGADGAGQAGVFVVQ